MFAGPKGGLNLLGVVATIENWLSGVNVEVFRCF